MKVRNGFVSNSSSSSFLIIGVKFNNLSQEQKDKLMNSNLSRIIESDGGYNEIDAGDYDEGNDPDPDIIGRYFYASEYDTEEMSFKMINSVAQDIQDLIGKDVDIDVMFGAQYG